MFLIFAGAEGRQAEQREEPNPASAEVKPTIREPGKSKGWNLHRRWLKSRRIRKSNSSSSGVCKNQER